MNFVFLTGNLDPIPAAPNNRRFMVLETPPARENVFYRAIEREIEDGGVDAFRHFLLRVLPMGGFNETTVPPEFERAPYGSGRPLHLAKGAPRCVSCWSPEGMPHGSTCQFARFTVGTTEAHA
jgi:hypothetical protein